MKRIIFLFKVLLFITSLAKANNSPAFGPRATFDSLWVDYNITEDGQKGMRIHLNFSAYEMKNMDAYVAIYFEYDDDIAGFLKDKNDKFSSSEGM